MNDTKYIYCVSSIKEKENSLIKNEDFYKLCETADYKKVCEAITDKGYDIKNPFEILKEEWDYIKEILPLKNELDFLIVTNDFLNLKGIIKSIVFKKNDEPVFVSPALANTDFIKKAISERSFEYLPEWMSDVAKEGYELLSETLDQKLFEMFIDFHATKAMIHFSKKSDSPFIENYCEEVIASLNIKTAFGISLSKSKNFIYDYAFFPSKKIDCEKLKEYTKRGAEELAEYIEKTDYYMFKDEFINQKKISDKFIDEYIFAFTKNNISSIFAIENIIAYYLYQYYSAKNISVILNFKKANKDSSFIKERLRNLYV